MDNITVDVSNWKMKDYIGFFNSGRDQDFDKLFEYLAKAVTGWEFEGDPSNPESYGELSPEQYVEVSEAVSKALTDRFQRK